MNLTLGFYRFIFPALAGVNSRTMEQPGNHPGSAEKGRFRRKATAYPESGVPAPSVSGFRGRRMILFAHLCELRPNLVYGRLESSGPPACFFILHSIGEPHVGNYLGQMTEAAWSAPGGGEVRDERPSATCGIPFRAGRAAKKRSYPRAAVHM